MRVCINGTFNRLHKGNKHLIKTGLKKAGDDGFLFIGIYVGPLLKNKSFIKPYEDRKNHIIYFINDNYRILPTVLIEPIVTVEGPTLSMDFDVIVVSEETESMAQEVNQKRDKLSLPPMQIVTIPLFLAEDGGKISST